VRVEDHRNEFAASAKVARAEIRSPKVEVRKRAEIRSPKTQSDSAKRAAGFMILSSNNSVIPKSVKRSDRIILGQNHTPLGFLFFVIFAIFVVKSSFPFLCG
jgi:hypothetical protein